MATDTTPTTGSPDTKKHDAKRTKKSHTGTSADKHPTVESETDVDDTKPRAVRVRKNSGDGGSAKKERRRSIEASPILEKGLVYFFLRAKVDVEHPQGLQDVKRSYMVLRPMALGDALGDVEKKDAEGGSGGEVRDEGRNRLIAIPKKKLPVRGYEKFLTFVEEPGASLEDIKKRFLDGRSYMTKTMGERTDYPAEPVGEGVYAITRSASERQSHFAYILTVPENPEDHELQTEFGLRSKGSFVISVRNPKTSAPANAGLDDPAEYSKEIQEGFQGLKWGAVESRHLDYRNAEILFIGEKTFPGDGEKGDGADGKVQKEHEGTKEELERLEHEDDARIKHLSAEERVFQDLEMAKKNYEGVKTTWGSD
ncbi:hypothetical protein EDC01DRAFT_725088 [Geopyxis carbonaria]|nr:hypothetical protein EDC01DRAFT_725088 [Geopyxis carbonaria]